MKLSDKSRSKVSAPRAASSDRSKVGRTKQASVPQDKRLYSLDVFLVSGPITEAFARKNKRICRSNQIRGDQTLRVFHDAIFDAFDREDEHMYEFQVGGKGPMDPRARRYVLPTTLKNPFAEAKPAGSVSRTTIGSLGLMKGDAFGYWFDFGDDWRHQVNVAAIEENAAGGKYPRVTKRTGDSPPQYPDLDEEGQE
jgi:hypothetical protein